jgi:DNA repair protein RecO (recombination protein O)
MRYGEADRILDLYTEDHGLVPAIAKGVRRTTSRFGGRLEPLSCVEFLAYHGRSLDTLTQAEVLRNFSEIREHLDRLEAAGGMVRAVRALSGEGEEDRRLFNLLYHALDALGEREEGFRAVEAGFILKLSLLAGYSPRLESCALCGSQECSHFSPQAGGVLCGECRSGCADALRLPSKVLPELVELIRRPLKELIPAKGLDEAALKIARAHAAAHAPGGMRERRPA